MLAAMAPQKPDLPSELSYILLLFGLFILPRYLQRFRIPSAITSLTLGASLGMGFGLFVHDATVELLSTFGIVSLFLFAGLEAEIDELQHEARMLLEHLLIRMLMLGVASWLVTSVLGLEARAAVLVALALLTPSAGFILQSLNRLGLSDRERFWIRSKAVASELVALGVLFVTLQSTSPAALGVSALVLVGMIVVLPLMFEAFARRIVPHAPKSEFAFLVMLAVVCAYATRQLGVYYLVGAFLVGVAAQEFRERLPALASEKMLDAVESFASLFVPFYFLHAGLPLRREDFAPDALAMGGVFLLTALPLRIGVTVVHRRLRLGEALPGGMRVAVSLLPTLVFTLVLAQILRERFAVSSAVFGGLIVYAVVNTMIPGLLLKLPLPEFEEPHVHDLPPNDVAGLGALESVTDGGNAVTEQT
jgi:Kef-type K+ transport system membrane component KefB